MEVKDAVMDVSLEYLKDTTIFNQLQGCFDQLEKGEEVLCALSSNTEDSSLTLLKVGSLLSFEIVKKMWDSDKKVKEFDNQDWVEIANKVADLGILADGRQYTEFVFTLYSNYIKLSVSLNEDMLSEEKKANILNLSDQIIELNAQLEDGVIKEPDYVDKCLWISFEAIIKLISIYSTRMMSPEFADLIQAASNFTVQYARLTIYSKEQALLQEYIEHQYVLDEELKEKYDKYVLELEEQTQQFKNVLNKAFDPEFKNLLENSVNLAREAGVNKDEILDSMDKIDDYFS